MLKRYHHNPSFTHAAIILTTTFVSSIPNPLSLPPLRAGSRSTGSLVGYQVYRKLGVALSLWIVFMLHVFGAMGAGDVKLFAAIGAVTGAGLVVPTFIVVILTGGLLAVVSIVRAGVVITTMHRVLQIFVGMLPGWQMPKFAVPTDRKHTLPYGVAITMGSIISIAIFRA